MEKLVLVLGYYSYPLIIFDHHMISQFMIEVNAGRALLTPPQLPRQAKFRWLETLPYTSFLLSKIYYV